ncbi:MAG: glycoside hydrolase family 127 protein, partial [Planctomycetales bacterium]|nr:glycoside hydrolase family 127 protein [Planctomycetales bacterium]
QDGTECLARVIWPSPQDNQQVRTAGRYVVTGAIAGTELKPQAMVTVIAPSDSGDVPQQQLQPFPLGRVTLTPDEQSRPTPFLKNRDKFLVQLAETDPNRFLYMFRETFGEPQPAATRPLGVWDSRETKLRGHATGHYLSALAQAYASTTYDESLRRQFAEKMNVMIGVLYDLSQRSGRPPTDGGEYVSDPTKVPPGPGNAGYNSDFTGDGTRHDFWNWGSGYISAYPPDQFIMLEQGAKYGTSNDHVWAPYYTLHKILAGLLDCYELGGNEKALEVAQNMATWVHSRLSVVPAETRIRMWNRYIAGEYGGMNEVMARLYRLTGDARFLDCARLFDNIDFFFGNATEEHGLARNVDTLRGKHANQHIPQITGALETYRVTGEPRYFHVARNFWDICTQGYMYNIGGVAGARDPENPECFVAEPNTLFAKGFSQHGQNETCATYNLLKLSRRLYMVAHDPKYMDYYEQALYNHILASVAETDAGNTYHVPLNPGARKRFGNAAMDGFTCCNGTALESNTKLQDSIYFRDPDDRSLYVNLFVPSTLNWDERNIVLTQSTSFPYGDVTRFTVGGNSEFRLKVRVPSWATKDVRVTLNGQPLDVAVEAGSYCEVTRHWQDGDTVELRMPMRFYLRPLADQPNIASLFYGPVLLAAEESGARETWRHLPLLDRQLDATIAGDPATLRFHVGDVQFAPFYETYGFHSVYLDVGRSH